jgi:alcohol dehydrogenase class IV
VTRVRVAGGSNRARELLELRLERLRQRIEPGRLGADVAGARPEDAGRILADAFISLMRATGLPSGIAALGYGEADVPALAEGAFAQQRPLVMAPRTVSKQDLEGLYRDALRYW